MNTLSKEQIDRQDFVDNRIFELINCLLPNSRQIDWDIEIIGNVRDVIYKEIKSRLSIDEERFYPFITEA